MEIQEHRNGVKSIEVQLLSVKDDDGKERNNYYGRKPTYKGKDGKEKKVILNLVEGEARRLIDAGRAIATSDVKKKAARSPQNKQVAAPAVK